MRYYKQFQVNYTVAAVSIPVATARAGAEHQPQRRPRTASPNGLL